VGLSDCTVQALLDVSDLDRAKRFYEQQLGLVPREEEEEAVRYPCADGTRDRRLSLTRERRQVAGDARGLFRR
jgi:catechol-2,3-dioxygenase